MCCEADIKFVSKHKDKLTGRIIDVGSRNVNGTARSVIPVSIGVDISAGEGVDMIVPAEKLIEQFGTESFDTVISTSSFEHMEHWKEALQNMWGVLKKDGWFLMTMAVKEKGYHAHPKDYWRMTRHHVKQIFGEVSDYYESYPSLGFIVQKKTDTLNLDGVELLTVRK